MSRADLPRDGGTDAAPALQRMLDAGGHVTVPFGTYRVGTTLRVRSGTRLEVHPRARLRLADGAGTDASVHLLTNAGGPGGGDRDIEVRGGVWDGNNKNNRRSAAAEADPLADPGGYTGVLIDFHGVERLSVSDVLLVDSEAYHLRCCRVSDFLIEDVRFHTTHPRPNNDGVHLGGYCERGVIRRISGLGPHAPSDDLVALNADDALGRIECQGKECGPIRDVVVHTLRADSCHSFVRILSVDSPVERIDVDDVEGGCDVCAVNMDGARNCRVPVFDAADPRYADGVGACADIRLSNFRVWRTSNRSDLALVRLQQKVRRLRLTELTRDRRRDACPAAPTVGAAHLPGHRLVVDGHANMLSLGSEVDHDADHVGRLTLDRA